MNVLPYLSRLGVADQPLQPDVATLRLLQHSHLQCVPFENLDIHWKRPIALDTASFFTKIVENKRGGFCYELNGLFNRLLKRLGFDTRVVSARVFNGTSYGPEYDHAAIIVTIGNDEYLPDVGFGAFTAEPLRFVLDQEQRDRAGIFVIRKFDTDYFEVAKKDGDEWKNEYIFKDIARELNEFDEMCDFQQFSPESHFTKGKLCSIMTENGRKTLTDKNFIVTTGQEKEQKEIESEDQFYKILQMEFGISKPAAPIGK
ncbi:MAG: arylamine N-acetyltransferase [Acidobacteria bacterium]|nr:arylamine N-acetyltransferase [Acidobacteriota bacterium]